MAEAVGGLVGGQAVVVEADVAAASGDAFVEVAGRVQALCDDLQFNPKESLALQALMVSLPPLAR